MLSCQFGGLQFGSGLDGNNGLDKPISITNNGVAKKKNSVGSFNSLPMIKSIQHPTIVYLRKFVTKRLLIKTFFCIYVF